MIVEELVSLLGLQVDPKAQSVLQRFTSLAETNFANFADVARTGALAFAAGIGAVGAAVVTALNDADSIGDASVKLGVTANELQRLRFAATASESDFETLTNGLQILQVNAVKAAEGSKELRQAFDGINLRNTSGQIRPANELLADLADKMQALPDQASRTALAVQVLGRSGKELVPLLSGGSNGLKALGDEAARLGVVMSDSAIAAGGRFDDAMKRLGQTTLGLRNTFAASFFEIFADGLEGAVALLQSARPFFADLGDAALQIWEGLAPVRVVLGGVARMLFAVVAGVTRFLAATGTLRAAMFVLTGAAVAYGTAQLWAMGGAALMAAINNLAAGILWVVENYIAGESVVAAFGATSLGAWLSSIAPLILMGVLIAAIADEIYGLIVGNDTLIQRVIDWGATTTAAGEPVLALFKAIASLIFDVTDPAKWGRLLGAMAPFANLLGGTFSTLQQGAGLLGITPSLSGIEFGNQSINPATVTGPQVSRQPSVSGGQSRQVLQTNQITINATEQDAAKLASTIDTHLTLQHQQALASFSGGL